MLTRIKELIKQANASYEVIYEDKNMSNVVVDSKHRNASVAYIEEFANGRYTSDKYRSLKQTRINLYFCKFIAIHETAEHREKVREQIEREIVYPFMNVYANCSSVIQPQEFSFSYPPARWDANEVGIMVSFDYIHTIC